MIAKESSASKKKAYKTKTQNTKEDYFSTKSRENLSLLIMNLFEKWQLKNKEKLSLLDLSVNSRPVLYRYKNGYPLPRSRDIIDRVGMFLSIHKFLRRLYADNPTICYGWIKMENKLFDGLTPLDVMINDGYTGVLRVFWYLKSAQSI